MRNHSNITEDSEDFFPISKKNYWIYKETRETFKYVYSKDRKNRKKLTKETIIFRKEITDVSEFTRLGTINSNITIATVCEMSLNKKQEYSKYFIIKDGASKYYTHRKDDNFINRLKKSKRPSELLNKEGNLFLDIPLYDGKSFNGTIFWQNLGSYCNIVDFSMEIDSDCLNIKSNNLSGKVKIYKVKYVTNPSTSITYYVSGVGVVARLYIHNGTLIQDYLKLIQYHKEGVNKNER